MESDTSKQERCPTCDSPDPNKVYWTHFSNIPISECPDRWHKVGHSLPVEQPNKFTIEIAREKDGRWLADIPSVPGAMAYGATHLGAILNALNIWDEVEGKQEKKDGRDCGDIDSRDRTHGVSLTHDSGNPEGNSGGVAGASQESGRGVSQRVETGPYKFADDWTGVFIRGDNALHYASILKRFRGPGSRLDGLISLLESCDEHKKY